MTKFYPLMQKIVSRETWTDLQSNHNIFLSFPQWTLQFVDDRHLSMQLTLHHEEYKQPQPENRIEDEIKEEAHHDANVIDMSEEMDALKRFYVEKFEGNILRDFFESGALKSECETKNGKRHGRYREFHENGKIKIRGKYANGQIKGVWRYYTEDGKFDFKEKF